MSEPGRAQTALTHLSGFHLRTKLIIIHVPAGKLFFHLVATEMMLCVGLTFQIMF